MKNEHHVIRFETPGDLDLNVIRLLGVSVKKNDNPIGFFGTGLKYAIATILRLGGGIRIFTGGEWHSFDLALVNIRGEDFSRVSLDGEPLGFTTELGKQWEPWMAVRELYSNTLDEQGAIVIGAPVESSELPSRTVIEVSGEVFVKVWVDKCLYFIDGNERPVNATAGLESYHAHSATCVFYRGIRVAEVNRPTYFKHNILSGVTLTEDRTLRHPWDFEIALERSIVSATDRDFIREILTLPNEFYEAHLPFDVDLSGTEPSIEFLEITQELSVKRPALLNLRAIAWAEKRTGKRAKMEEFELSPIQRKQLDRAIHCMDKLGFLQALKLYPIVPVEWLGPSTFGMARDDKIYLSRQCFEQGTKFLFSTLLEEFVHCRYGYPDNTRELQTWLFDRITTITEEFVVREPI